MEKAKGLLSKKWVKVLLCAVLVVALICGIAVAAVSIYVNKKLNLIDYQNLEEEWVVTPGDMPEDFESESDLLISETELDLPTEGVHREDDIINILLLGTDERSSALSKSSRADSIMLMSIDKSKKTIKLISFERAIIVKMPNGKKSMLGNSFHYGGPKYVISEIQSHFNVDVDKYVRVNFKIFEKLVNAVGGVDITLTEKEAQAMNHEIRTNTFKLDRRVKAGLNHLNGFEALQYSRLRYTDSDWVRIKRQRTVIKALQKKMGGLSVKQLDSVSNEILPLVQTNLEKSEIIALIFDAPQMLKYSIDDMTIPQKGTYTGICSNVNYKKNSRIIDEFLYGE